jgi:hypothetical protein
MKKTLLSFTMFILAIASALSGQLLDWPGYTTKDDVPIQAGNCQMRKSCPGGTHPCTVVVDHDGFPFTAPRVVPLYDGTPVGHLMCGQMLFEP